MSLTCYGSLSCSYGADQNNQHLFVPLSSKFPPFLFAFDRCMPFSHCSDTFLTQSGGRGNVYFWKEKWKVFFKLVFKLSCKNARKMSAPNLKRCMSLFCHCYSSWVDSVLKQCSWKKASNCTSYIMVYFSSSQSSQRSYLSCPPWWVEVWEWLTERSWEALLSCIVPATPSTSLCRPQNDPEKSLKATSYLLPKTRSGFLKLLAVVLRPAEWVANLVWPRSGLPTLLVSNWLLIGLAFGAKLEQGQVGMPRLWPVAHGLMTHSLENPGIPTPELVGNALDEAAVSTNLAMAVFRYRLHYIIFPHVVGLFI